MPVPYMYRAVNSESLTVPAYQCQMPRVLPLDSPKLPSTFKRIASMHISDRHVTKTSVFMVTRFHRLAPATGTGSTDMGCNLHVATSWTYLTRPHKLHTFQHVSNTHPTTIKPRRCICQQQPMWKVTSEQTLVPQSHCCAGCCSTSLNSPVSES